ncbi:MAG: glucans biosynthesis glucosyltransferase MdoH, partial [Myxococcota bacterium]
MRRLIDQYLLSLPVPRRRFLFGTLVLSGVVTLAAIMLRVLAAQGLTPLELGMLACYVVTLPWQVIGFWNAVLGFAFLRTAPDPVGAVSTFTERRATPITAPTALALPIRNEAVAPVFRRIRSLFASLDAAQPDAPVALFVLSDSDDPAIIAAEEAAFASLRETLPGSERVSYRRRTDNAGYKAGNVRELVLRRGEDFRYLVVLDADSLMTVQALQRALAIMERRPRLGLLQTLVVGLPAESAFARLFQFGMRQGMRSYTTGSCWWQGAAGPYWGHNAVLRMRAFRDHGALPVLPGAPPLGGPVLSHDQVEAALMRAGGWDVRVLPLEDGSFEENPPTIVDYLQRNLRWCQGNMQYLRLLPRLPSLRPMGRVQMLLAIWMYLGAPAWMGFLALGVLQAVSEGGAASVPQFASLGGVLFGLMMLLLFAPKVLGVADLLLDPEQRRRYGGTRAVLAATGAELLFSLLLGPVVAVHETVFMGGLLFGRTTRWSGQNRAARNLPWRTAVAVGALPTLLGLVFTVLLALRAPALLPFALPVLAGWLLAIPFAWATGHSALGRWMARRGLAA